MRLFIGIPLASEAVAVLERHSRSLQSAGDNLRWSSPDTWHITVQFLGETSVETYACVVQRLGAIKAPPVPIWLRGTSFFDRSGVFFAAVSVSPELRRLQQLVTAATAQCGVVAEDRPYHPHVTLARAKGGNRGRALHQLKSRAMTDVAFPAFTAHEFLLYESFLRSDAARHEIRARFSL